MTKTREIVLLPVQRMVPWGALVLPVVEVQPWESGITYEVVSDEFNGAERQMDVRIESLRNGLWSEEATATFAGRNHGRKPSVILTLEGGRTKPLPVRLSLHQYGGAYAYGVVARTH